MNHEAGTVYEITAEAGPGLPWGPVQYDSYEHASRVFNDVIAPYHAKMHAIFPNGDRFIMATRCVGFCNHTGRTTS